MEEKIIAQKGTIDEWPIYGCLEGNIESKNLVLMIHGGGYDRNENGIFPVMENGKPKKEESNGKSRMIYTNKPYGNYERLSTELQADEIDCAIFRMDVRNHGRSTNNGKMDTRDTEWTRFSRDLSSVIKYLKDKYGYENIHLVGTCMGALIAQYYIAGIGANKDDYMEERQNLRSATLISPLAPQMLCTTNPAHGFGYKKAEMIRNGEISQFTKMKGLFEGRKTLKEAEEHLDLAQRVAKTELPIMYISSPTDRIIPIDQTLEVINDMQVNPNFTSELLLKDEIRGLSDHCFYDPQSSDACLRTIVPFIENQIMLSQNRTR